VRQVAYLAELYEDSRSEKYLKIMNFVVFMVVKFRFLHDLLAYDIM
jgi:hypothetical protein